MTFLELTDLDQADLAVELYFAGDAETLDAAAALAADLGDDLYAYLAEWDAAAGYIQMPEGDMLGPDGLRA
jgi:hypothetical protein